MLWNWNKKNEEEEWPESKSSSLHAHLHDAGETLMNSLFSSLPSAPSLKLRKSWLLPIDGSETVISTRLLSLTISHKYLLLDTGEDRWHGKPQLSRYKHRVLSKHLSSSLFCWLLTGLCLWKGLPGHSSYLPALIILCQCVIKLQGLKKISVAPIRFFATKKLFLGYQYTKKHIQSHLKNLFKNCLATGSGHSTPLIC